MIRGLRHVTAALAAAALAAVLTGCGGEAAEPSAPPAATANPVAWAEAYCAGVTAARDAALEQLSVAQTDPAAQKQALGDFLAAAEVAYQDSLRQLAELGAPTVDAGAAHHQAAMDLYRSSLESVQAQQRDLTALDSAAPDITQRLTDIVAGTFDRASVQERTDAVSTDPQLAPALAQAQSCQEGRPGGGS